MSDQKTMTAEAIRVELTTALCRQLTAAVNRAREEQGVAHLRAQRNDLQARNSELVEQRRAAEAETDALIAGINRLFDAGPADKPSICTWCGHTATTQEERLAHAPACAKSPAVQRAIAAQARAGEVEQRYEEERLRRRSAESRLAGVVELLGQEAAQLRRWAEESTAGGWSTHQVNPMLERATHLDRLAAVEAVVARARSTR